MPRTLQLSVLGAAGALLCLSAAPALATTTPVVDGCPASTTLYSVGWLESQGPWPAPARRHPIAGVVR